MSLHYVMKSAFLCVLLLGGAILFAEDPADQAKAKAQAEDKELGMLWTVDEKYEIVVPLLERVEQMRKQMAAEADAMAKPAAKKKQHEQKIEEIKRSMETLFQKAADAANAKTKGRYKLSAEDVRHWTALAANLGKSGLITPSSPDLRGFAAAFNGTWELESRYVKGRKTDTSGRLYYDLDPKTGSGAVLVTESGTAHAFVSEHGNNQPFAIGAYVEINATTAAPGKAPAQGKMPMVTTKHKPQFKGSYGEFRAGVSPDTVTTYFVNQGGHYMVLGDLLSPAGSGEDTWVRFEQVGGTMVMSSSNVDLKDVYRRVSKDRPLVSGVWPIKEYWRILSLPTTVVDELGKESKKLEKTGVKGVTPHLFLKPPPREKESTPPKKD
jgi:hypothetical protein